MVYCSMTHNPYLIIPLCCQSDIPELRSDDPGPVVTRRGKSYSPRRMESASLIENEHLQLPDTVSCSKGKHVKREGFTRGFPLQT